MAEVKVVAKVSKVKRFELHDLERKLARCELSDKQMLFAAWIHLICKCLEAAGISTKYWAVSQPQNRSAGVARI
jgi:hypothetical protein